MRALVSYLQQLAENRVPFVFCDGGPDGITVVVTTISEHWESVFAPDGSVATSLYLSDDWIDGDEGLAAIVREVGGEWTPTPESEKALATLTRLCAALRGLGATLGYCDTSGGDGVVLVVGTPHSRWEVTLESELVDFDVDKLGTEAEKEMLEATKTRIACERFTYLTTLEGERALAEPIGWWTRFREEDETAVDGVTTLPDSTARP